MPPQTLSKPRCWDRNGIYPKWWDMDWFENKYERTKRAGTSLPYSSNRANTFEKNTGLTQYVFESIERREGTRIGIYEHCNLKKAYNYCWSSNDNCKSKVFEILDGFEIYRRGPRCVRYRSSIPALCSPMDVPQNVNCNKTSFTFYGSPATFMRTGILRKPKTVSVCSIVPINNQSRM